MLAKKLKIIYHGKGNIHCNGYCLSTADALNFLGCLVCGDLPTKYSKYTEQYYSKCTFIFNKYTTW